MPRGLRIGLGEALDQPKAIVAGELSPAALNMKLPTARPGRLLGPTALRCCLGIALPLILSQGCHSTFREEGNSGLREVEGVGAGIPEQFFSRLLKALPVSERARYVYGELARFRDEKACWPQDLQELRRFADMGGTGERHGSDVFEHLRFDQIREEEIVFSFEGEIDAAYTLRKDRNILFKRGVMVRQERPPNAIGRGDGAKQGIAEKGEEDFQEVFWMEVLSRVLAGLVFR